MFPGFQVSWFPRFPGFLGFLGFQVALGQQSSASQCCHVPKAKVTGAKCEGNLETWKPGNLETWEPEKPGNLETFFQVSRFPGSQVWQGPNPDPLDLDLAQSR